MASVNVRLTCQACGYSFWHSKSGFRGQIAAGDYQRWAQANVTLCPDCYRASKAAKPAAPAAVNECPAIAEITAVMKAPEFSAAERAESDRFVAAHKTESAKLYGYLAAVQGELAKRQVAAEAAKPAPDGGNTVKPVTPKKTRRYYAGYSYMGTNYTYDSPCWIAYAFDSKKERDAWVAENEYRNGNTVATKITRREAEKIAGSKKFGVYGIYWQCGMQRFGVLPF